MPFPFENLNVYQQSLTFVENTHDLIDQIKKKTPYSITDQLSRASLSIPLNIAEGNGRWHKGEKKQYFRTSLGSLFECVAILQVVRRRKYISAELYTSLYQQMESITKMLINLIKSVGKLER